RWPRDWSSDVCSSDLLPAAWKSPDNSASRSQVFAGAIAASSLRRSSESDTFELQQTALVLDAERSVRADAICGNDAVTRNDERRSEERRVGKGERGGR